MMNRKLTYLILILMVAALGACSKSDDEHAEAAKEHASKAVEHVKAAGAEVAAATSETAAQAGEAASDPFHQRIFIDCQFNDIRQFAYPIITDILCK